MSSQNDSKRLRQLLLGDAAKTLDHAEEYFNNPRQRAEDVAEVLASANLKATEKNSSAFTESLKTPVNSAIRSAIKEDAQEFADSLYPAILPAIRRAINETMRQFVERIDTLMAQRYSAQSMKWRLEAMRTGVPFSEIILRKTLVYRIEQILLIHNESGLLMQHVHLPDIEPPDSDAVSGMLWAIESFVRDSFTGDEEQGLSRVTMGDHIIYLVHGPKATIASVVRGVAPDDYFVRLRETLEQIHALHGDKIEAFAGDKTSLDVTRHALDERLESSFQHQGTQKEDGKQGLPGWVRWVGIGAAMALVAVLTMGILKHFEKKKITNLVEQLQRTPGIEVTQVQRADSSWQIKGLRDPLALSPKGFLVASDLNAEKVDFNFTPFLSLDPTLVSKRARKILQLPDSVNTQLQGHILQLSGTVRPDTYLRLKSRKGESPLALLGIDIDASALNVQPDAMPQYLQQQGAWPTQATAKTVEQTLTLSGYASTTERQALERALTPFADTLKTDLSKLQALEALEFDRLGKQLEALHIPFVQGITLGNGGTAALGHAVGLITRLHQTAKTLGIAPKVYIIGETDSVGSSNRNKQLRQARAEAIRQSLIARGIPAQILETRDSPRYVNPQPKRQVRFELGINE